MTKKVCFMTEKVFVLMQPVLHVGAGERQVVKGIVDEIPGLVAVETAGAQPDAEPGLGS